MAVTERETQQNPLLEGLVLRRTPEPCALVIYGASGDLTRRKLFPALYALAYRHLLPDRFAVLGVARTEQSTEEFRAQMEEAVREHGRDDFREDVWDSVASRVGYMAIDFADESGEDRVKRCLLDLDDEHGTSGNRVHYLSVPPAAFETLVQEIGERRDSRGWTRPTSEA